MANWEGVSEFVAVAQAESFTAAAKRLNTSVAQVSRRVSALEGRLAVKLLHRTTRQVTLSEAGQIYYQQCRHLIEGLEVAELSVMQMQSSPKGVLKVTAPVTYGETRIAPLIYQFLTLHPLIDIDLVLSNQKLDLIEQGMDVAIRLGRLEDSSLVAKRLSERQLYVCASPKYLEHNGEPHTLSELNQHSCLVGSLEYWRFNEQGRERSLRVSGRVRCNSGLSLLDAAKRHFGLVQLPDYYVKEALEQGELKEVLSDYRNDKEGIWAVYPQNKNLSPKVRLLIDFLSERLS